MIGTFHTELSILIEIPDKDVWRALKAKWHGKDSLALFIGEYGSNNGDLPLFCLVADKIIRLN